MSEHEAQLVAGLIALAIALPLAVTWTWLICRHHERLQSMRPKLPPSESFPE